MGNRVIVAGAGSSLGPMPTGAQLSLFVGGTAVFALLPGPGMRHVLARGLRHGWADGVWAAAGVALGTVMYAAVASLGLAAVSAASPRAFTVVRIVGVAALVLLGSHALFGRSQGGARAGRSLTQGIRTVRTPLFLVAFLSQFGQQGDGALVFVLLGLTVVLVTLVVDVTVACCAGALGVRLAAHACQAVSGPVAVAARY
jgi:threonine/homoserine/homoserine lactone efflux protein